MTQEERTLEDKLMNDAMIEVVREGMDTAPVIYTNSVSVRTSIYDFELLVSRLNIGAEAVTATALARIIMSPQHMKSLVSVLASNVEAYERNFGTIQIEAIVTALTPPASSDSGRPSSQSRSARKPKA